MFINMKWIEIAGFLAVVLSLVFVGMELRQNTAALSAQALLDLNLAVNEEFQAVSGDETFARIMLKSADGLDELTPVEIERLKFGWLESFNTLEAAYLFYRKGIISRSDYSTYRRAACSSIVLPGVRQFLESGELNLNPEYAEHLEQCGDQKWD